MMQHKFCSDKTNLNHSQVGKNGEKHFDYFEKNINNDRKYKQQLN